MFKLVGSVAGCVIAAGSASAVYGLRYQVSKDDGATWSSIIADARSGDTITFRVLAYHDGTDIVSSTNPSPGGSGATRSVARHVGTHKITNWRSGDVLVNWNYSLASGNSAFRAQSIVGNDQILGTPSNAASFTAVLLVSGPRPYIAEQELARGFFQIGSDSGAREMVVQNNTFGAGNFPGLTFYYSDTVVNSAAPTTARVDEAATVLVNVPAPGALSWAAALGLWAGRRRVGQVVGQVGGRRR